MTPDDTPHEFRPLDDQHDRAAFSCGDPALDNYFRNFAGQSVRRQLAAVRVVSHTDSKEVIGYYTLTSASVNAGLLPVVLIRKKKYRESDAIGITLLGRFAIGLPYQRKGWGVHMFMDASYRALEVSRSVASSGILVDTETEGARNFWRSQEFISLPQRDEGRERFFLSMDYIEKLHNTALH